jgi:catechol-2,3-dioxygenase
MFQDLYVDHLVYRVRDSAVSSTFYQKLFGDPIFRTGDAFMYKVGPTHLFFTPAAPGSGPYDKEQPGLNHIALGTSDPAHLRAIASHLYSVEIPHSGIGIDSHGQKEYLWLNDPDGFRLEFYCRPALENAL